MNPKAVYANLSCAALERSVAWFTILFERGPDERPMTGLAEWHHSDAAGLQVYEAPENAGHCTLTLIVTDLAAEHKRLTRAELAPPAIEKAHNVDIVRLRDPDDNLIVLAQPRTG